MYINETCEHYCGDEDCAKCDKYGILTGGCICAFERFISSIPRLCKNCKHYKISNTKTQLDHVDYINSCERWECEYEPKDNDEEERMSIWAN